ncbi:hypothetical protein FSY45_19220 [Comamonas sp. Z1]|uniref:hypothetical protein n=1 Tax=Comamonas sp. Z1 TaxID=2601246 RepID=UPI0011E7F34C|nr:hypothetical protein [Comamonas sp. Z1]TYK74299.1 hypothetical protein FSY45_19220 [Comamonas sp. Z1]
MTTDAIEYNPRLLRGSWCEEDIEYLLRNAGRIAVSNIATALGKGPEAVRKKIRGLGLNPESRGLPEALDDLQYIPEGMTIRKGPTGDVYRVPTSSPGIVSRTVHIAHGSWNDEDEEHAS